MLLVLAGSIRFGCIKTFWDKKIYMKTCYISKIFGSFDNFPCMIFLAQNVSIPAEQNS